ncbi:hypothetical protein [Roseateles subflavus]|uniref:hypothetical protein n=1 Tax=Roseateles subflavus TaxID=3053353 RepID=UPI00255C05A4|nr:hypothetical protein [Pelomonas sp. APW6]
MRMAADRCSAADHTTPGAEPGVVHSVPALIAAKRGSCDLQHFGKAVSCMREQSTRDLIIRLESTADALTLWALHLELDKREVPPCLRWPANDATRQAEFITLLADLLWFCRRNPEHRPRFRGWRDLLNQPPASARWHHCAHRQFLFIAARRSVSHWCATGLDLSDQQRQDLMTLETNAMRASRRALEPRQFAGLRERLECHSRRHPDKSGRVTPAQVASRRALLWRTYVLAGRSPTRAVEFWALLSGEELTRQALSKQIALVAEILRKERLTAS